MLKLDLEENIITDLDTFSKHQLLYQVRYKKFPVTVKIFLEYITNEDFMRNFFKKCDFYD